LLVLEATRRVIGLNLMVIACLSLLFGYFGPYMPELIIHKGYSVERIATTARAGALTSCEAGPPRADPQTGLSDLPVLIYYSVNGGSSWSELTSVTTNQEGDFSAVWLPSVTGNFLVKAYYLGNEEYGKAKTVINLAVTSSEQEENVFSVSSNSTLSGLSFNSEERELRFSVSGDNGTFGYVNVFIPKSLIADVSELEVYLDEEQIDYIAESKEDYWLLRFSYSHSTHEVSVMFSSLALQDGGLTVASWMSIASIASIAVIAAIMSVFFIKGKNQVQE